MNAAAICDALSMDYQTYMNQPKWFIELIIRKRAADNEYQDSKNKSK